MRRSGITLAFAVAVAATIPFSPARAGTNILQNTSFETQYPGNPNVATNWNYAGGWIHGGYWGSAIRINWRFVSGAWEGALRGSWSGNNYGGLWQEAAGEAGMTYEASGWFWEDNPGTGSGGAFTAGVQELKIEFYNASFTLIGTISTNLTPVYETWTQKVVRGVAPAGTAWARWVSDIDGASAFGALQMDDISLSALDKRDQDFNYFTNHPSDACFTQETWSICTGKTASFVVSGVDTVLLARSGYCASLPNPLATSDCSNAVMSPRYTGGVGTVIFYYRHGSQDPSNAPVNPVSLSVELSADLTNWSVVDTVTNIVNTNYLQFQRFLNQGTQRYVRIRHAGGSTNRLLIDDVSVAVPAALRTFMDFDEWPGAPTANGTYTFAGWTLSTGSVASVNAYSVYSALLAGSTNGGSTLQSPFFSNGVGTVTFVYRAQFISNAVSFALETSTSGTNWTTIATTPAFSNTVYTSFEQYLYQPSGAYVRIRQVSGSSTNGFIVDNVNVASPVLYRTQQFDTWPTENNYGGSTYQGWLLDDARVVDDDAYSGQSAIMKDTVNSNAYIQSPPIPNGIGSISFKYIVLDTTPPGNLSYVIQTSTNGVTWTNIDSLIQMTNQAYQQYSRLFNFTNQLLYVRLYHTGGASRVSFDDISLSEIQPPASVSINGFNTPTTPYTNDTVVLSANVSLQYDAVVSSMTSFYRIGTSGAFTALGMASGGGTYDTTSSIPAQPAGTVVQYYMRCDFTGPGSESNSPTYFPTGGSNAPTSYRIPRNRPASIWINEANYMNDGIDPDMDTNEFIELAGPAGSDIGGWQLEFVVTAANTNFYSIYVSYTVPNGTVLSNDSNGYGFFVLGDIQLGALADRTFTHTNDYDGSQIADAVFFPSGVRLLNEGNGVEQTLCFDGYVSGFTLIGYEDYSDYPDPYDLQLRGTGTTSSAFTWNNTNSVMTPGAVNVGQAFPVADTNAPPTAYFIRMTMTTNLTFWSYGNSNDWNALPYYTTNLWAAPQTWLPVTPYFSSYAGGTNTIWFNRPGGTTGYYYRIVYTNGP